MMTLDELLGNQTQTTDVMPTQERFPSYEEFASSRNRSAARADSRDRDVYNDFAGNRTSSLSLTQYVRPDEIVRSPLGRSQNFYEYVARQNKEVSDADLYERLSRSNESLRPVFNREKDVENTAVFKEVKEEKKARGRLNVKGKLIIGTFLALVITTVSLIIAYAGKINSGTATTPASNEHAVVSTQSANI